MVDSKPVELVIVGSVSLDTVETRAGRREEILGGSATFACAAAALFSRCGMVGVVGSDFPAEATARCESFGIDLQGLQQVPGKTFRWGGVYDADMINRSTLFTELGVFADFSPELPASYRGVKHVLLGNIAPSLQLHVLEQVEGSPFVATDTMDLWIDIARDDLMKVLQRTDLLMLNDGEARALSGCYNLMDCAAWLREQGPEFVVIKKGEHGAMLFSDAGIFLVPAYPVREVIDPTGAGDTFAGSFMGMLARGGNTDTELRRALMHASVVASFGVEGFSLDCFDELGQAEVEGRMRELETMVRIAL